MPAEKMIRLGGATAFFVNVEEYEQIRDEILARHACGDITLGVQVLAKLLLGAEYHYNELKLGRG